MRAADAATGEDLEGFNNGKTKDQPRAAEVEEGGDQELVGRQGLSKDVAQSRVDTSAGFRGLATPDKQERNQHSPSDEMPPPPTVLESADEAWQTADGLDAHEADDELSDAWGDVPTLPAKNVGNLKTKDLSLVAHGSPQMPTEAHNSVGNQDAHEADDELSDAWDDVPTLLDDYRYELEFVQSKSGTSMKVSLRARDGSRFKIYIGRYKIGALTDEQIQRAQLKTLPRDVRLAIQQGEIDDGLIDHIFSRPGKGETYGDRSSDESFPQDSKGLREVGRIASEPDGGRAASFYAPTVTTSGRVN